MDKIPDIFKPEFIKEMKANIGQYLTKGNILIGILVIYISLISP